MGLKVAWVGDDLAPVGKLHTSNDLWQLVVAVKATPGLLRAFDQLEDHGERGPVREASLRADRPVSDGREGAFDRIVNGAQNLLRSVAAKFPSLAGGDQPLG